MTKRTIKSVSEKLDRMQADIDEMRNSLNSMAQLVGPFGVPFPDGSLLTQTIHGNKYFIDPEDLIMAPQMVIYRQWEADMSNLFRSICTPDTVIADVGANFGYFAILAASLIGNAGAGSVFAFEPNPKLASLFRKNKEINWSLARILFEECAITDVCDKVILNIPNEHGANGTLSSFTEEQTGECIEVQAKTLDTALPSNIILDVLKIDVEGHEFSVLRGAQDLISRSPNLKVVMEWSQVQMELAGVDPSEIKSLLHGFECHEIALDGAWQDNVRSHDWLADQAYTNVVFSRSS